MNNSERKNFFWRKNTERLQGIGLHHISEDDYVNDPGLSRSEMLLWDKHFQLMFLEKEPTKAQIFGTSFHKYFLEQEEWSATHLVEPDFEGKSKTTKADKGGCKEEWGEFKDRVKEEGKEPVTRSEISKFISMKDSLLRDKFLLDVFERSKKEASVFFDHNEVLKGKARLDIWSQDSPMGPIVIDVKTCNSANPANFSQAIRDYSYDRQGAYYLQALNACYDGLNCEEFWIAAVEKHPPYLMNMFRLDKQLLRHSTLENRSTINDITECVSSSEIFLGKMEKQSYTDEPYIVGLDVLDNK